MKTYLKPQTKAAGIEEHQAIPMIALCCGVSLALQATQTQVLT